MLKDIRTIFKKLLQYYLLFGICNLGYKWLRILYLRRRAEQMLKHLPGSEIDFSGKELAQNFKNLHEWIAKPGIDIPGEDLIRIAAPGAAVLFNSERSIKWLLKDQFDNITKPNNHEEIFRLMRIFLGPKGIFVLQHGKGFEKEHSLWVEQRKVASLIFTKKNFMTTFYQTFVDKALLFQNHLKKFNGKVIDIEALFFSYTMDSIEKFFMGTDVNTLEGGMSRYAKAFDNAHRAMLAVNEHSIKFHLIALGLLPFPFGSLDLKSSGSSSLLSRLFLFFSKDYKKFKANIAILDEHILNYIKKTRTDSNLGQRKDVIANFLNSSIGNELDDQTLRDIVLSLTIAGRDTTACALSWLFFELTQNLNVQEKLISEIDEKLEGKIPRLEDLEPSSLLYLNGVIYEVLRLHPSVPTNLKFSKEDLTFPDGTRLPAYCTLLYSPRSMGRNPLKYPNPLEFNPKRWIPFEQPSPYEFPVFQAGPRFCLGKDMAQFEMKLLTVMLLQKFRFTLKPGEAEKVTYSLMLTQSIATDKSRSKVELLCIPHERCI